MKTIIKDDNQLVIDYINGDENSLGILLQRHKRKVYTSIYLLVRNRELAEDIFQDTFVKVIHSLKSGAYHEEGKFLPWVIRIARNLVIDHFRRDKKIQTIQCLVNEDGEETDIFSVLNLQKNDDHEMEKKEFKKKIRSFIELLPDEQKEVLLMRVYYDMSFKEISDFSKVSINTSLGRMRYALINLKKMLENKNQLSFA
jgi:RNA polymerase sigma-70 factor (ECF subfamily)